MKKIVEYDVLRVILTILVVIGHCSYVVILSQHGGVDYAYLVEGSKAQFLINVQNEIIYMFHMPCYFALSGAIFSMQCSRGKLKSYGAFCVNKAQRLIIPFFVVGIVFTIPLKFVTGYWDGSENVIKDIFFGQILLQGNTHLWFLVCLFFIFLIFRLYVIFEKNRTAMLVMSILIIGAALLHVSTKSNIVNNIFNNLIWFWCGYNFEKNRESINQKITPKLSCLAVGVFLVSAVGYIGVTKLVGTPVFILQYVYRAGKIVIAAIGSTALYSVCFLLSRTKLPENKLFNDFNGASFGVYLYSDPLNYVILFGAAVLLPDTSKNINAVLIFVCRLVLTLVISYILTAFLRKKKIKYIA